MAYRDVLLHNRLSVVAVAGNSTLVDANPEHLDLDWFGTSEQNFWPGKPGGTTFEDRVAEAVQQAIENSFGIPNSADAKHTSWTWDTAGNTSTDATWQADLTRLPPAEPANLPPIRFEWSWDPANAMQPAANAAGPTVQFSTRKPGPAIELP
jgi:hypothetical protein